MRTPAPAALWTALPVLALLLAAGTASVVGAPAGPKASIRTLDLARVEGRLTSLDGTSLTLRIPGGTVAERTFRLEEVVHLAFAPAASPRPTERHFRAYLVDGGQLVGRLAGPVQDGIALEVPGLGRLGLLFEHVLTLEAIPADAGPCADVAATHQRPASGDLAIDARGDEYAGTVLEATESALVLESKRGRKRRIAWDTLRLVHLENETLEPPGGLHAEVELANGSRLAVAKLRLGDKGLGVTLRAVPGTSLTAAFDAIRTVRWSGGRFDYASALPHEATWTRFYGEIPGHDAHGFLERGWYGPRVDRRKSGCPLRLGGVTYRHGFGVNSRTVITIPLGGAYATFRTTFGIDDEVLEVSTHPAQRGDVDARILADGKVLWEAKGVRGGEKPRTVGPLDVRGAKSLVLEVDFGKARMELDRANWCDPILVKTKD